MAYAMEGYQARPKKHYIATASFQAYIYEYIVTQPTAAALQTTGKLQLLSVSNSGVTAAVCPAGRILRETGAHLYPGVHPGLQPGETNYFTGANHIWTKVYDAITGFSGYIDANADIFATYSNERPEEFVDNGETDGTGSRKGPSVYTGGNVTAVGSVTAGAGLNVTGSTVLVPVSIGTLTAGNNAYNFNTSTGTYYTATANTSVSNITPTVPTTAGTVVIITIYGVATAAAVTFTAPFKASATAAPAAATNRVTVTFVSDGTNLIEISRASV